MYTTLDYINKSRIFDLDIEDHPMVLFHGTSCHNESAIEENGIEWNPNNNIPKNIIDAIIDFHKNFHIIDFIQCGYSVLGSYSVSAFENDNEKPIFLTDDPNRALLYATKDYSGGETIRSLRGIYRNLMNYIHDPSIRPQYIQKLYQEIEHLLHEPIQAKTFDDITYNEAIEFIKKHFPDYPHQTIHPLVKNSEIKEFLDKYRSVFDDAIMKYEDHSYGIIYAIKFSDTDKDNLKKKGTLDFVYNGCINNAKIIEIKKISDKIVYKAG